MILLLSPYFFFFSSFLYFFQISQYSQPTLSLPSSAVKKLPNIVVCPQHYLLGLAKRTHFSQLRPLRFPRLLLSPDPRIPHESQKPQVAQSHPWGPRPFAVYLQLFNDKASLEETHSSKEAFLITPLQPPPYSLTSSSASWPLSPNPQLFFFYPLSAMTKRKRPKFGEWAPGLCSQPHLSLLRKTASTSPPLVVAPPQLHTLSSPRPSPPLPSTCLGLILLLL